MSQESHGTQEQKELGQRPNNRAQRAVIAEVLFEQAAKDRDLVVLCSDSRGSAALDAFFETYPHQAVEVGIAEQDLVGIAAGLAACGKKAVVVSPASFLATRSYEQARVDVAYGGANVILVGISGGIAYGELGMTHQSTQDIAALAAVPGMRVYLPSDPVLCAWLMTTLLRDAFPAYVRVGRNPVAALYSPATSSFVLDRANVLLEGSDVAIVATGELVAPALEAARLLCQEGISASVTDMWCVKPLDEATLCRMAHHARAVVSVEEHGPLGGLGARVAQVVGERCPRPVKTLALPDRALICGSQEQLLCHYGLDAPGIAKQIRHFLASTG